jgi:hypothetical protein
MKSGVSGLLENYAGLRLGADTVEKVESSTSAKISMKSAQGVL